MITVHEARERGTTDLGWLKSRHTFSFGSYQDERQMGFRSLRVINDDRVEPGKGFGTHGHQDMEILSYVLDGALAHRDSMGTGSVIHPGEIQFMRAGTGVTHSEFNDSRIDEVHFLQIWIIPAKRGLPPAYDQRPVDAKAAVDGFTLLASPDGREGSIRLEQDALLYLARPAAGARRTHPIAKGRHAYLHVATGQVTVNGKLLGAGSGAALSDEPQMDLQAKSDSEVLLFDLA